LNRRYLHATDASSRIGAAQLRLRLPLPSAAPARQHCRPPALTLSMPFTPRCLLARRAAFRMFCAKVYAPFAAVAAALLIAIDYWYIVSVSFITISSFI